MTAKNQNTKDKGVPLKVLILEDRAPDAELMLHELRVAGYDPTWKRVETEADFRQQLSPSLDIIFADYNLPQFTGLQAIDILNEINLDIPVIVVTGAIEEAALECLKRGAVDYLIKDRLGRLGPAVNKALEDKLIREDKKLAAEALRASEQRYRGVAETAVTGLSIADTDDIITYSNPALAEMLGYTTKELLGMPLINLFDPEESFQFKNRLEQRKEGLSNQYETKMKRKDGEVRIVIFSASPLTNQDGYYEGSQAVITDITERVQAEEKFKIIFGSAPDPYYLSDLKGKFLDGNKAAERLTGYLKEELLGKSFLNLNLLPKDQLLKATGLIAKNVLGQSTGPDEFTINTKDGGGVEVEITTHPVEIEGKTLVLGIARDITERVQAEKSLEESEAKLRLMIDNSPIGFSATDLKGNFLDVNPAMCLMLGYSKKELLAKHFNQVSHPDDRENNQEMYQKLVEGEIEYFDLEKRYIHKTGKSVHVQIRSQLTRSYEGEPLFEFALVEDITARVRAEKLLKALNRAALSVAQALTPDEIFTATERTFKELDYDFIILTMDKTRTRLHTQYSSYGGKALQAAEKLVGLKQGNFSFPIDNVDVYDEVISNRKTIYLENTEEVMSQVVPGSAKKFAGQLVRMLQMGRAIVAPLIVDNEVTGILSVQSDDLIESDGLSIATFAHQVAAAWRKAQLYEQAQREITERKLAEAQLKLQSHALESAANAIVITDAEGSIQWANSAFSTLTGYALEEALENNPRFLKSGQHDDKFYKNLWDTISTGQIWQGEIINKRKDGELYTEEMTIAPLLSEENEISNYIAIKQDITERKRTEKEIRQRTEDLALINTINNAVNQGMDLPEILILLNKEAKRVFSSKSTALYLYNQDDKCLELQNLAIPPEIVKRIENLIGTSIPEICVPVKEGSYSQVLLNAGGPQLINDAEVIQEWMLEFTKAINLSEKLRPVIRKLISQIYKLVNIQSVITVPLISAGEVIGLMDFSRQEPFTVEDTKRAADVVGQLTAAITSLRAEKEKAHSRRLLLTLSQAAPVVQQANNAHEIFRAIGERVVKMGFNVTVFTLTDDKNHLVVSYQSLKENLIRTIEKLTNLSVENYSFPLKAEGYYHKIITNKETVFSQFDITQIEEILPRLLRPLANKVMNLVDHQQSIVAPLIVDDEVLGLMAFTSPDLSEYDTPAIKAFTNQAAIALEKTQLFHETEALAAFNESIIQNMAEGIVLEDVEGMVTFVNPAAVSMLGYTSEEWVGKHWTEIVPPDQQHSIQKADERRMRGESDRYELELANKEDQRISVLVSGSPRFDGEDQFDGTMAVFTDITERKQTEEKISRFSRIFEDSLNEIFLFDIDTLKFTQVNSAGQNNLGYTMDELYELTPLDIKPEFTAKSFEYLVGPLRNNEKDQVVFETVHQRKDGSLYNVEVHLQLLRYKDETLFAAIIMDITERYQAEIESKRYIRRLDALLNIDQAIMGSFDLQVTLNIILEHLITQLAVDAATVLSYQADLQTLTFTQSRGFQTPALKYTDLRLGEGYAGEVGLQRDYVFIPDLNQAEGKFQESPLFSQEGFVSYYGLPLLAKGKLVGVLEIFNRSALDPGDEWVNYLRLLAGQIAIAIDNISLFNDLQRSNIDLTLSYDATIEGWARALELKDMETEGHSRRVVDMTLVMARRLGVSGEKLGHIRRGALLHDIGKMGIPDSILQKPGKLTDDEWQIMRQHPVYAYDWLSRIQYLQPALEIPYSHHERWDGTGYPRGLAGEQIPLAARIFSIVDVWDALNSDRPYRKAWSTKKIMDHIKEESGKHFDPLVVDKFLEMLENDEAK